MRMPNQAVHVIHFDQSVAELFVLNCSLCVTPMLCGYSLVGVDEGIDSNVVQHIREQHSAAYIV